MSKWTKICTCVMQYFKINSIQLLTPEADANEIARGRSISAIQIVDRVLTFEIYMKPNDKLVIPKVVLFKE